MWTSWAEAPVALRQLGAHRYHWWGSPGVSEQWRPAPGPARVSPRELVLGGAASPPPPPRGASEESALPAPHQPRRIPRRVLWCVPRR
eukprot:gene20044-biopygen17553